TGISSPIVLMPMAFRAHPKMAAIVSRVRGFGFVPVGLDTADEIKENLRAAKKMLAVPNSASISVGISFIGWVLDIAEVSDLLLIPATLAEKLAAIWFTFSVDLGKHIKTVREYDTKCSDCHKTLIFVALRATNEWKVDFIVVQGIVQD
ncbi:hypothetical protein AN958_10624, partial [Leucoagaricus sp. SymC.cos]